ncbi:hypothetical protein MMC24_004667 [Lignoscripta atroalba]|nr:hypothetical protein [Lignoscripta atroalba]
MASKSPLIINNTFLNFDINLSKPSESPIPINGQNLYEFANKIRSFREDFVGDYTPSLWHGPPVALLGQQPSSRFLLWPGELRNKVYKLVLVKGILHPSGPRRDLKCNKHQQLHCSKDEAPALSLLRVCRQVHDEAGSIYYSSNEFVVGCGDPWQTLKFCSNFGETLITKLRVSFSDADLDLSARASYRRELLESLDYVEERPRFARESLIHEELLMRLEHEFWAQKGLHIAAMPALQHLSIDIENADCPHGCCRLAVNAALWLAPKTQYQAWYRRIEIIGARSKRETLLVLAAANGGFEGLGRMENMLENTSLTESPTTALKAEEPPSVGQW